MAGVQQQVSRIDKFLAKEMPVNTKTQEEIEAFQKKKSISVTIQGTNTELLSLEGLEAKFKQENDPCNRVCVPSTDILEWKGRCPLSKTTRDVEEMMKNEYKNLFSDGENKIKEKEALIDAELEHFMETNNTSETANKIAEISADAVIITIAATKKKQKKTGANSSPVKEKIKREVMKILEEVPYNEQKKKIHEELKKNLHTGIDQKLTNTPEWGIFKNRRGQIGENRTIAAMNDAVESFGGFSVSGMKTHSYLPNLIQGLGINLTYKNTTDKDGKMEFHEVEHDGVITFIEKDRLTVNVVQSKTNQLRYLEEASQEERRQAAHDHCTEALKQVHKDMITFKELFPDISTQMMDKIR